MRITGTVVRLAAVVSVQLLFTAIIIVVFGQLRFDRTTGYTAEFSKSPAVLNSIATFTALGKEM